MTTTPPDWYPDPEDPTQNRYWDGTAWTDHRRPVETQPHSSGAPSPDTQGTAIEAQPLPPQAPIEAPPPQVPRHGVRGTVTSAVVRLRLTGAEQFWYVMECIAFGTGYLAKVPMKKALKDAGLTEMTGAEGVWYIVLCIMFGAGYFAKIPVKKALNESGLTERTGAEQFWYVVQCILFGSGYFAKVPMKKALSDVSLTRMTDAGQFWYVLQNIAFGHGYFAKVPMKKALSELPQIPSPVVSS